MSSKFTIRLNIAGKSYPMTIERDMEEKYRRAEKEINQLVSKFRGRFLAENSDYLAMAAIQIAVANVEMEMSRSLGEDIDALMDMDKELEGYLSSLK